MKKTIINLAIAAIAFATPMAIMANADNSNTTENTRQTRKQADKPRYNPFEGLNLTEAQQTKLNELKKAEIAKRGNKHNKRHQPTCNQKQSCDNTKQCPADDRAAKAKNRTAGRAEYLAQVKQILTPEQYVKYLENSYLSKHGHKHNPKGHMKANNGKMRGGKKDKSQANGRHHNHRQTTAKSAS